MNDKMNMQKNYSTMSAPFDEALHEEFEELRKSLIVMLKDDFVDDVKTLRDTDREKFEKLLTSSYFALEHYKGMTSRLEGAIDTLNRIVGDAEAKLD